MDKILKRRRAIIFAAGIVLAFVVLMIFSTVIVYLFERSKNLSIVTISDAFAIFESVFNIRQGAAVNAMTTGGRITVFSTIVVTVILAIWFAAQLFAIVGSALVRKTVEHEDHREAKHKKEIIAEIDENQELEEKIIEQQEEILEKEEDIISKLDSLRKK
jgi:hypothetical protein